MTDKQRREAAAKAAATVHGYTWADLDEFDRRLYYDIADATLAVVAEEATKHRTALGRCQRELALERQTIDRLTRERDEDRARVRRIDLAMSGRPEHDVIPIAAVYKAMSDA